jgi:integrase
MFYDIELTKKAFKEAKRINDTDTEYRVKGKPNLRLIVYRTRKSLAVRYCQNRIRKIKTVGSYPHMTLANFVRVADEIVAVFEAGGNYALALEVTLNQFFDQIYLPTAKKNKISWADDESRYRLYVALVIGQLTLAKIKPYHVQRLLNELPEHLSDRSHDLIRALISVIFSQAIQHELLDKNPCRVIPARNNCKVKERHMQGLECTAFIESGLVEADINSQCFSYQSLCLLLALFTGMRIGNCIAITRSMLSSDSLSLYLPTTKSGKPQRIFLSPQAQWLIKQALSLSDSEFIFPSAKNNDAHIGRPSSAFIRICARAGIACTGGNHDVSKNFPAEVLTIHCLRKTFATIILNNFSSISGAENASSIDVVRQLLGHASEGVTRKHYAFSNNENLVLGTNVASSAMTDKIRFLHSLD